MNIRNIYDNVTRKHITDNTSQITSRYYITRLCCRKLSELYWALRTNSLQT